ncbi:MAG: CBS domain-containing protein, partial [Thermodesulfobacteriota bacterium]
MMKFQYKGFIREKVRRNPVTISPDASFFKAKDYLHVKGARHLPVVDNNDRLVGIVTDRDI